MLHDNKLGELPAEVWANMFSGLGRLEELWLNGNDLSELHAEVWTNMLSELDQLQKLVLYCTGLNELPAICSKVECYNY